MNDFNISLIAGLDSAKSKENINQDIDKLKSTLNELTLQAKIDPNQAKNLEGQLDNLKVKLQVYRIETPEYIMKNDLQIDYKFYITNQLREPCLQIMNLFYKKADILFNNIIKKCDLLQQGYIMNDITKFL